MRRPHPNMGTWTFLKVRWRIILHRLQYQLTNGRKGGLRQRGDKVSPILLLTTVGRKTGKRRTTPLNCLKTERGWAVAATFAGSDMHPAWYLNLRDAGEADIQVMERKMHVRAETVDEQRRAELWARFAAEDPNYQAYERSTKRTIPVVELVPV